MCAFLQQQRNLMDWLVSKFKQSNQYHAKDMFGDSVKLPSNFNAPPPFGLTSLNLMASRRLSVSATGSPQEKDWSLWHTSTPTPLINPVLVPFGISRLQKTMLHTAPIPLMLLTRLHPPRHHFMSPLMPPSSHGGKKCSSAHPSQSVTCQQ